MTSDPHDFFPVFFLDVALTMPQRAAKKCSKYNTPAQQQVRGNRQLAVDTRKMSIAQPRTSFCESEIGCRVGLSLG